MNAYEKFNDTVAKAFQAAVDEVALVECLEAVDMIAYFALWGNERNGVYYRYKPLQVVMSADDMECIKTIDLEDQWEDILNDYGDDDEIGAQVRANGKQLVFELRRVAKKLELQINEMEKSA
jgi:hypothetical protein